MTKGGGRKWDPDRNCPVGKVIPGWRELVDPFRQDSMFWHGVWRRAESPNTGVLHNIMTRTRNKYHYAVRKVKKKADEIRARQLFEAAEKGDIHLLMEMKKLVNSKSDASLPECVEGADNPEEIVEKFRVVYSALYNSAPSEIQQLLESIVVTNDAVIDVNKVTGEKVKEAACRMKPNKNDVSGGYSSDAILNGPDSLFECLAAVIRSFLLHGTVSMPLLACAFLPLLKSLKDPAKTESYRAI